MNKTKLIEEITHLLIKCDAVLLEAIRNVVLRLMEGADGRTENKD